MPRARSLAGRSPRYTGEICTTTRRTADTKDVLASGLTPRSKQTRKSPRHTGSPAGPGHPCKPPAASTLAATSLPRSSSSAGWQPLEPRIGYSVCEPSRQPPPLVHLLREPCFPGTDLKLRCCMTSEGWGTLANLTFSPAPQVQVFRRLEGAADVGSLVTLLGLLGLLTSSVVKPRGHGRNPWKSGAQFHLCHYISLFDLRPCLHQLLTSQDHMQRMLVFTRRSATYRGAG